ncbi:MAG: hypothetical protein ACOYY2_02980 [Actinomycetota bacterium]
MSEMAGIEAPLCPDAHACTEHAAHYLHGEHACTACEANVTYTRGVADPLHVCAPGDLLRVSVERTAWCAGYEFGRAEAEDNVAAPLRSVIAGQEATIAALRAEVTRLRGQP